MFFTLSFSKSETSFIYCAEAKASEAKDTPEERETKFRFLPDFGERLIDKKKPTLYLFKWTDSIKAGEESSDLETSVAPLKPTLPEGSTFVFGQGTFTPDNKYIFATGYPETLDGRRLGPFGCWNHPSSIFKLKLPDTIPTDSKEINLEAEQITSLDISARSPRVTDANSDTPYTTVWLENRGPAHASVTSLVSLHSREGKAKVLVDYVQEPKTPGDFPGLYIDQLPSRPFLSLDADAQESTHVVSHSNWGSHQDILAISLKTGDVWNMTSSQDYAYVVAGTDGQDGLLAVRSAINSPFELLETRVVAGKNTKWKAIDKPVLADWGLFYS